MLAAMSNVFVIVIMLRVRTSAWLRYYVCSVVECNWYIISTVICYSQDAPS